MLQVMEEERGWRQGILQEGATDASVQYGRANLPSLAGDNTEPACSHCATFMFLSCITCSCRQGSFRHLSSANLLTRLDFLTELPATAHVKQVNRVLQPRVEIHFVTLCEAEAKTSTKQALMP